MSDPTSPMAPKESEAVRREKMIAQLMINGSVVPFDQTLGAPTAVNVAALVDSPPATGEDEEENENPFERAIKDTSFQFAVIDNHLKIIHDTSKTLLKTYLENQESMAQLKLIGAMESESFQGQSVVSPSPVPRPIFRLVPWIVAVAVCFGIGAFLLSRTIFLLEKKLEAEYRDKLTRAESITAHNKKTLQLLGDMGIILEIRKPESGEGYFLLFKGSQKVETGIDSPEGPNVRFFPK